MTVTNRPENQTGKSHSIWLLLPVLTDRFLIYRIKTEMDKNGTQKTGYGIENGLTIFCPFTQDPVFI
jgi:hypothetical protein